jgi:hypothetical protein
MTDVVPETPPPANRGLWMLVIGLGIAILIVIAAMIGLTIRRAMDKPEASASAPPVPAAPVTTAAVPARPGEAIELNITLAPGEAVADARLENATLLVRITSAGGDQLLIIDPASSRVLHRIRFNRNPEKP